MTPITVKDYFMGRDASHAAFLTDAIRANAVVIVDKANRLLALFYADRPNAVRRGVRSGWRPPGINAGVGGAPQSKHMDANAVDIEDNDRELALWCAANSDLLEQEGLWMERPEATSSWCHWQDLPPKSGARFFWPTQAAYAAFKASGAPPMVAA